MDAVVFHKQLGDTLLLEPALSLLAEQSGSEVALVTRPGFEPLVGLMEAPVTTDWKGRRFDRVIAFDSGSKASWLAWQTRARRKELVLMDERYGRWYHRWVFHETNIRPLRDRYRACYYAEELPIPPAGQSFRPPSCRRPPEDWASGLREIRKEEPFILIHPTSAWKRKCWPESAWVEVIHHLLEETEMPVVLTSGPSEWEVMVASRIADRCPDRVLNIGGRTNLKEYLYVLSRSRIVLSVDGSAGHIAQAFRVPSAVIFGPTAVSHWHQASGIAKALSPGDFGHSGGDITAVPPAAVLEAARALLAVPEQGEFCP